MYHDDLTAGSLQTEQVSLGVVALERTIVYDAVQYQYTNTQCLKYEVENTLRVSQ